MQLRKLTFGLSNESKRLVLNHILLKRAKEDFKEIVDKKIGGSGSHNKDSGGDNL